MFELQPALSSDFASVTVGRNAHQTAPKSLAMSSQMLPRRMNAMSIQQVAAAEEFAAPNSNQDDLHPESQDSSSLTDAEHSTQLTESPAKDRQATIQQSLDLVGNGIQALLSESLSVATGEVKSDLRSTVQQHVQDSIRKSLPSLSQQLQKEARRVATVYAEQMAHKTTSACLSELKASMQQHNEAHQKSVMAISARLDETRSQNTALHQTNEQQRKVIVALVRKVTALENNALASNRHQQKTDQRLTVMEQPADLDAEWKDLLTSEQNPNSDETNSAA